MNLNDFVCFKDGDVVKESFLSEYTGNSKDVEIPESFELIEFDCFRDNTNIESVVIPESVKVIKSNAFSGCTNLKSVKIPGDLYGVSPDAFGDAQTTAKILKTNPNYIEKNNLIINKSNNSLLFAVDTSKETYSIPEVITSIGLNAFCNCANLKEITIPESVEYIGMMCFFYCTSLTKVVFPKELKSIEGAAFSFCDNLKDFTIGEGVAISELGNEVLFKK